jgi:hypothetical protein
VRLLALVAAVGALGCATTHELGHPARMPSGLGPCSIGVGALMDEAGVDHALDLRDYLRAHGPCRRVVAVMSPEDDSVDLAISGKLSALVTPSAASPVSQVSSRVLGVGLGLAVAGAVLYGVAILAPPAPDSMGFVNPDSRATQKGMETAGIAGLAVGGALSAVLIGLMVADSQAIRQVSLDGRVDVELTLIQKGRPVAELHEHDVVTARGKHPPRRPEPLSLPGASGPLYREVMARVFEHVAARAADAIQSADQAPR